jgi:hypothetical protein
VTTDTSTTNACSASITKAGSFNVLCANPVPDGAKLNYVVIN